MSAVDMIIVVAYAATFLIFRKREAAYCASAMLFSSAVFILFSGVFAWFPGVAECYYFLIQSTIWLFVVNSIKTKTKASLAMFMMVFFELTCSVESFIWQFIYPVTTPVIEFYAVNIVAIHAIMLTAIALWGKDVNKRTGDNINNFSNLLRNQGVVRHG